MLIPNEPLTNFSNEDAEIDIYRQLGTFNLAERGETMPPDAQIPARDHLKGLSDTEMPLIMLTGSAAFLDFVET